VLGTERTASKGEIAREETQLRNLLGTAKEEISSGFESTETSQPGCTARRGGTEVIWRVESQWLTEGKILLV